MKIDIEASVESVDVELFGGGESFEQRGINDIFIFDSESLSIDVYLAHVSLTVTESCFSSVTHRISTAAM
jgi:hypothetical protein